MESQVTLMRALVASVPAGMLFAGALVFLLRGKTLSSFLQLLGAGCLMVVVLAHICEALKLFPSMGWGLERRKRDRNQTRVRIPLGPPS